MRWISFFAQGIRAIQTAVALGLMTIFFVINANATPPSTFRQPHPLAWMHASPGGELPGWEKPFWFEFETSVANNWGAPLRMTDKKTGAEYRYQPDYEQLTSVVKFGGALTDRLGITFEVPYANRSGGFLDEIIDDFHVSVGNRRFNRQFYPDNEQILSVTTDGVNYYDGSSPTRAASNVVTRLKYWLYQVDSTGGQCPCGISLGYQLKIPTENPRNGGTTGDEDHSALLYMGAPIGKTSAVWFTAGYSWLGDNPAIEKWPRKKHIELYELNFDIGLGYTWGIALHARAESPFLDVDQLQYEDTSTSPVIRSRNRAGSAWNSLVRWRGTNGGGLRYRTRSGNQWQLMFIEDWGIGPYDASDNTYSNNSPDVNLVFQSRFEF